MPKIDFGRIIWSMAIALAFFAIGRLIVLQTGGSGRWLIFAGLIIFYAIWWFAYRRRKRKE